jgi:hypothetical protein
MLSPAPVATATPGPLDHFLCYEAHRPAIGRKGVTAVDQYGVSTITVRQAKHLCAPVNKNGEDPTAPSHAGHLSFYTIKQSAPSFVGVRDLSIRDQFGTLSVDLVRPERLLVPTSKSLQAPPPPPLATPLNHFKCYRVRGARQRVPNVSLETQFGSVTVAIKRPWSLCVPVNKNDEGIVDPSRGLMCYQVRAVPQSERHVFSTDQFGSADYDLFGIRDLCVPLIAGPGTCGDGTINSPGEQCETGSGNDAACPGACRTATCTCPAAPAVCGNGVVEPGEQCETGPGNDAACPGRCNPQCTCDPVADACSNPLQVDGTPCDDGNACTRADTCQAGSCTGADPVICTPNDQCHDAGTCDSTTGVCSNPLKAAGSACDDANACTTSDTCQGGTCTAGSPVVCTASDQCHDVGTCDSSTGACSNPPKPAGSACNDANACTTSDTCQGGTCTGTSPVVCTASDLCHAVGTCNPTTGACSNPSQPDGSPCNDGSACTQVDTCHAGVCGGGAPVDCSANQCRNAGTCDPATGTCSGPVSPDGTGCDDGNLCTTNDTCANGICVGDPACGDTCTVCHTSCDPATGQCTFGIAPDGTACGGAATPDECHQPGTCQHGMCTGTALSDGSPCGAAPAGDSCLLPGTCQSGFCVQHVQAPDFSPCSSDGNACTLNDTCLGGVCTGQQKNCSDGFVFVSGSPPLSLTVDTCDPATGACVHTPDPSRIAACEAADCIAGQRCCFRRTIDGGFVATCTQQPVCEDTTGIIGTACGGFVCEAFTTCCGDVCCQQPDECVQGVCHRGPGQICGNDFCQAPTKICDLNAGVCIDQCGTSGFGCLPSQQCCTTLNKCCDSAAQICGNTDCEAANPCPPGDEVHLPAPPGDICCFPEQVCGGACCAPTAYCDACTQQCVPLP